MKITKMVVKTGFKNDACTKENTVEVQDNNTLLTNPLKLVKTILLGATAIFTVIFLSSCARKAVFQISPVVPAAQGYVKTKKDNNNNFNVYVRLENLAEPSRLTPGKQTYVVWIVAKDNSTKNVGQVKTSTSLFSHALKGSFETVSASKPVKVFITAEDDASVQYPGSMLVMTTKEF